MPIQYDIYLKYFVQSNGKAKVSMIGLQRKNSDRYNGLLNCSQENISLAANVLQSRHQEHDLFHLQLAYDIGRWGAGGGLLTIVSFEYKDILGTGKYSFKIWWVCPTLKKRF